MLARASEIAAPLGTEAVTLLARTYAALCEGQILELQLSDDLDQGLDGYFRVVALKTASLIRTSARLGAMAGGADRSAIEAASRWALEVGMIFQLTDDILDVVATEAFLGKPAGSDIGEGTFTLPLLLALQGNGGAEIRRLLIDGHPFSDEAIARVLDIVREGDSVKRALDEVTRRTEAARDAVASMPSTDITKVFESLGDYLVERVDEARAASG